MNIRKKRSSSESDREWDGLSRAAFMILRVGLPAVLFYLLGFLSMLLEHDGIPAYILARKYCYTLEHIIMSAALIVTGALAIDLAQKHMNKNK